MLIMMLTQMLMAMPTTSIRISEVTLSELLQLTLKKVKKEKRKSNHLLKAQNSMLIIMMHTQMLMVTPSISIRTSEVTHSESLQLTLKSPEKEKVQNGTMHTMMLIQAQMDITSIMTTQKELNTHTLML